MIRSPSLALAVLSLSITAVCWPVQAAEVDQATIDAMLQQLSEQQDQLESQQSQLAQQRRELERLRATLQDTNTGANSTETAVGLLPLQDENRLGLSLSGYGVVNYYGRDWDTDEFAKDSFDTERFILELEYRFDERFFAKAELEFEHGGTGATLELDTQEEFGEFEQEIEKGGEVLVEELYVGYAHNHWLNAKFGRFYVPVGRTNRFHKPQDYFTVARSAADAAMIPQLWHENGVSIYGTIPLFDLGHLWYEAQLVSALDSTGFSSRNWVAGGHQKRFEEARAQDLAFVARLDYYMSDTLQLGGAYYGGNSKNNRPKNDLGVDAFVDILEVDGEWSPGNFIVRGQYMWGRLQNSHLVTEANRNLSNNLGVKRTPVGAKAQSWFLEAGYDLLPSDRHNLTLFGRFDAYDSMFRTEGFVFDNPRWDRESWTLGLNFQPLSDVIFKAEYNVRSLDIETNNKEKTLALGVGFTY